MQSISRYFFTNEKDIFAFELGINLGVNKRISECMYFNVSGRVDRISNTLYLILVKLNTPALLVPPLITTIVNYYILELGDESFFLSTPAM